MALKIKFWGVRGSLPSSASPVQLVKEFSNLMHNFFQAGFREESQIEDYLASLSVPRVGGYGPATTCVEVKSGKGSIIIDGGSGLRALGEELMKGPAAKGKAHIHIFLTHFHWDHLLGLPFFIPHFVEGNKITYYAVQPELPEIIKVKFRHPFFPVAFETLPSTIEFVQLEPRKTIQLQGMKITPYQLDHPDPCWGFKIQEGGKTYAHCVDTEGTRITREALGPDLPLYQGVNLMYYDAQYTLPELAEKLNWGHSAAQLGLDIAFREGIENVIFGHHDPGASTKQIFDLKKQTREYYDWKMKSAETNHSQLPEVKWLYGYEGLEVDLDKI